MGKHLMVALFTLLMGAAFYAFVNREKPRSRPKIVNKDHMPRVLLEDFVVYKYEDHRVISSLSGKLASFYDPSTLELIGDVKGLEHNKEKSKSFSAESVTFHFAAKGLSYLAKDTRIESTEIENQVRFRYDDLTLYTDYAKYLQANSILSSELPVRIQGSRLDFMGNKGFEYSTKTNDLKVYGPLEGTLSAVER